MQWKGFSLFWQKINIYTLHNYTTYLCAPEAIFIYGFDCLVSKTFVIFNPSENDRRWSLTCNNDTPCIQSLPTCSTTWKWHTMGWGQRTTGEKMLLLRDQCMSQCMTSVKVWPLIVNPFTLPVTSALYEKRLAERIFWAHRPLEMWTVPPFSVHFYGVTAGSGLLDKGAVRFGQV